MNAKQLWKQFTNDESLTYDAYCFGDDADYLAQLVVDGIKTATCSNYIWYEIENEPLPKVNEYSIILNSKDEAICIIRTTKVYIAAFNEVTSEHAYKEGEKNRTLEEWREIHRNFFANELKQIGKEFKEDMKIVCEEFEVVYK